MHVGGSSRLKAGTTRECRVFTYSSWPGLTRPSTSSLLMCGQDVDARHKAGHDEVLTPQPRPAVEPGEIVIIIFRRFRAHDGVADAGVFAGGVIDVLADGAG